MGDWAALLRLAAIRFSLSPEAFWRISVREWRALTAPAPTDALGGEALNRLMRRHPDKAAP